MERIAYDFNFVTLQKVFLNLFIYLFNYLFIYLFIHSFIYLFFHLFIYLFLSCRHYSFLPSYCFNAFCKLYGM